MFLIMQNKARNGPTTGLDKSIRLERDVWGWEFRGNTISGEDSFLCRKRDFDIYLLDKLHRED